MSVSSRRHRLERVRQRPRDRAASRARAAGLAGAVPWDPAAWEAFGAGLALLLAGGSLAEGALAGWGDEHRPARPDVVNCLQDLAPYRDALIMFSRCSAEQSPGPAPPAEREAHA